MSFVVIIPARFASTRLPGKPLQDINGKPMIVHVLERARESGADRIIVATDHEDVARAVEAAGGEVCMTRADHQSGTERLAEVVEKCAFSDDTIIVNIQGDEPMIPPAIVRQVAENLAASSSGMATLAVPIHDAEEAFNPNAVKVVMDAKGYALYFSRATIPWIAIALPNPARPSVTPCCVTSASMAIAPALSAAMSAGRRARWSRLKCSSSCECCGMARKSMSPWRPKCPAPAWIPRKIWSASALSCVSPLSPPCWRGHPRRFFAFFTPF